MSIFWTIVGWLLELGWSVAAFFDSLPQVQVFLLAAGTSFAVLLVGIVRSRRVRPGPAQPAVNGPSTADEELQDFAEFYMDLCQVDDFSMEQANVLYRLSQRIREQKEGELMLLDGGE